MSGENERNIKHDLGKREREIKGKEMEKERD